MPRLLFVYGTLHPDRAPASVAPAARLLKAFAPAKVRGRLYDLGRNPGVLLSGDPADTVAGELFLLPDGPLGSDVLARLDDHEDFRPADPAGSLFLRRITLATLEDGTHRPCWIYLYNRPMT